MLHFFTSCVIFSTMPASSLASFSTNTLFLLLLAFQALADHHTTPATTPACRKTCGTIPVRYPFGTGFGCGHPDFARYIKCTTAASSTISTAATSASAATETLQLTTATGVYTITSIDYPATTITVLDPLMSTCASMELSGSFGLDKASPLSVSDRNIFVLLGCSTTSPLFDPDQDLCNKGSGSRVCRGLYSCRGVTGIGLPRNGPINTCCVYDSLAMVGSSYALDLPKLQCSSYASIYEFGDEGDPMKWKFGIALQYNDSYYSSECRDCEESEGVCGFAGLGRSFACICPNGINTTVNCFGRGYAWSGAMGLEIPIKISIAGFFVSLAMLFMRTR